MTERPSPAAPGPRCDPAKPARAASAVPADAARNVVLPGSRVATRGEQIAALPTTLDCLRCQLLGRRRLLCSKADACRELPHAFVLGPVLVAAWLATWVAFLVAVW